MQEKHPYTEWAFGKGAKCVRFLIRGTLNGSRVQLSTSKFFLPHEAVILKRDAARALEFRGQDLLLNLFRTKVRQPLTGYPVFSIFWVVYSHPETFRDPRRHLLARRTMQNQSIVFAW